MEIYLSDEQDVPLPIDSVRRLARTVLEEEGLPPGTEVGIMFVTDEVMAGYNRRFLGREGPTDVMALPLNPADSYDPAAQPDEGEPPHSIGDVFVAPRFVGEQAGVLGAHPGHEISLMVAHGLLHLLGYDHVADAEAEIMEDRERVLLAMVGVERR